MAYNIADLQGAVELYKAKETWKTKPFTQYYLGQVIALGDPHKAKMATANEFTKKLPEIRKSAEYQSMLASIAAGAVKSGEFSPEYVTKMAEEITYLRIYGWQIAYPHAMIRFILDKDKKALDTRLKAINALLKYNEASLKAVVSPEEWSVWEKIKLFAKMSAGQAASFWGGVKKVASSAVKGAGSLLSGEFFKYILIGGGVYLLYKMVKK